MLTTDEVVEALAPAYSPIQELPGGVLLVSLGREDINPVELRIEAERLRVFAVLGAAPSDSLRILSVATQPDVIKGILHHLDRPTAPPSSSRAPPAQVDLPWDDVCM
jgi:hypothetical protein